MGFAVWKLFRRSRPRGSRSGAILSCPSGDSELQAAYQRAEQELRRQELGEYVLRRLDQHWFGDSLPLREREAADAYERLYGRPLGAQDEVLAAIRAGHFRPQPSLRGELPASSTPASRAAPLQQQEVTPGPTPEAPPAPLAEPPVAPEQHPSWHRITLFPSPSSADLEDLEDCPELPASPAAASPPPPPSPPAMRLSAGSSARGPPSLADADAHALVAPSAAPPAAVAVLADTADGPFPAAVLSALSCPTERGAIVGPRAHLVGGRPGTFPRTASDSRLAGGRSTGACFTGCGPEEALAGGRPASPVPLPCGLPGQGSLVRPDSPLTVAEVTLSSGFALPVGAQAAPEAAGSAPLLHCAGSPRVALSLDAPVLTVPRPSEARSATLPGKSHADALAAGTQRGGGVSLQLQGWQGSGTEECVPCAMAAMVASDGGAVGGADGEAVVGSVARRFRLSSAGGCSGTGEMSGEEEGFSFDPNPMLEAVFSHLRSPVAAPQPPVEAAAGAAGQAEQQKPVEEMTEEEQEEARRSAIWRWRFVNKWRRPRAQGDSELTHDDLLHMAHLEGKTGPCELRVVMAERLKAEAASLAGAAHKAPPLARLGSQGSQGSHVSHTFSELLFPSENGEVGGGAASGGGEKGGRSMRRSGAGSRGGSSFRTLERQGSSSRRRTTGSDHGLALHASGRDWVGSRIPPVALPTHLPRILFILARISDTPVAAGLALAIMAGGPSAGTNASPGGLGCLAATPGSSRLVVRGADAMAGVAPEEILEGLRKEVCVAAAKRGLAMCYVELLCHGVMEGGDAGATPCEANLTLLRHFVRPVTANMAQSACAETAAHLVLAHSNHFVTLA